LWIKNWQTSAGIESMKLKKINEPIFLSLLRAFKLSLNKIFYVMRSVRSSRFTLLGWDLHFSRQLQSFELSFQVIQTLHKKGFIREKIEVLDVGCGDAKAYKSLVSITDVNYVGIDYGLSEQFKESFYGRNVPEKGFTIKQCHYLDFKSPKTFNLIVASHVAEHQLCIEEFLSFLLKQSQTGTIIVIEIPLPHQLMIGGHVALLTPAILAYGFAKLGVDVTRSISIIKSTMGVLVVQIQERTKNKIDLSRLMLDLGELDQLAALMPDDIREGGSIFAEWDRLTAGVKY
jgi:SAM-dependent methyltransferase